MALQINPWDDTYENQLSVEEKIREKRIALELLRKENPKSMSKPCDGYCTPKCSHEVDWMYTTDCPLCGKVGLLRIDDPVCTSCQFEVRNAASAPYTMDFDNKSWYAKVRPIQDTKINCDGIKYAVLHTMSVTDELGFRRKVGKQSQITHFVTQEEEKLADVLDNQCTECFTKIWKENTCHMCLKESSQTDHDLCKTCQEENPRYDPLLFDVPLIDQKLGLEVCKDEAKESLQKRKDYYAKTDAQEQEYLESERRKNEANCSRHPKKRKSREAKK